jgi:hypothetical protein
MGTKWDTYPLEAIFLANRASARLDHKSNSFTGYAPWGIIGKAFEWKGALRPATVSKAKARLFIREICDSGLNDGAFNAGFDGSPAPFSFDEIMDLGHA